MENTTIYRHLPARLHKNGTQMDYTDLTIKAIPVAVGVMALFYKFLDFSLKRKTASIEDTKFAIDFLHKDDGNLHPFAREKLYQTITKSKDIDVETAAFLVNFREPVKTLRLYTKGRSYLTIVNGKHSQIPSYDNRVQPRWKRWIRYMTYIGVYLVASYTAFAPWTFSKEMALEPEKFFIATLYFFACFAPIALRGLYKASSLWAAKQFIQHVDNKSIKKKGYKDLFSSKDQQKRILEKEVL